MKEDMIIYIQTNEITIFYFIVRRWMCMTRVRTPAPYRLSSSPRPHRSTSLYKVSGTDKNTNVI